MLTSISLASLSGHRNMYYSEFIGEKATGGGKIGTKEFICRIFILASVISFYPPKSKILVGCELLICFWMYFPNE